MGILRLFTWVGQVVFKWCVTAYLILGIPRVLCWLLSLRAPARVVFLSHVALHWAIVGLVVGLVSYVLHNFLVAVKFG